MNSNSVAFGSSQEDFVKYAAKDRLLHPLHFGSLIVVIDVIEPHSITYGDFLGVITGLSCYSDIITGNRNNIMLQIKWELQSPLHPIESLFSAPKPTVLGSWVEAIDHLSQEELLIHPSQRVRMFGQGAIPKYTWLPTENE